MGSPVSGIQVLLTCMVGVSMLDWRMTADIFGLVSSVKSSVKPWPEILIFLSLLRLGYVIALLGIQAYGFSPDKLCRFCKAM